MAETKTAPTQESVEAFLNRIPDEERRRDAFVLSELLAEVTGEPATMWGSSIVGFGQRHYKYASGREGDIFLAGFSPRKEAFALYVAGYLERYESLLQKLGKYKTGKGCLYVKRLKDVDLGVLRELFEASIM